MLLTAVGRLGQRGEHLKAFFAVLLLRGAAPVGGGHAPRGRPAPAQDRVGTDRPFGVGIAGGAWTDEGTARQERGLKHRADNETRTIPIPPVLVGLTASSVRALTAGVVIVLPPGPRVLAGEARR
jgi:hypothetical protein